MSYEFPAGPRVFRDGGNAPGPGPTPPSHAQFPWTPKNRGPIRLPERVPTAPTIRHSFPENRRSQHRRNSWGWRVRIRGAEFSRGNRAGSQVQASKGPEVPSHFSDRSPLPVGLTRQRQTLRLGSNLPPCTNFCSLSQSLSARVRPTGWSA